MALVLLIVVFTPPPLAAQGEILVVNSSSNHSTGSCAATCTLLDAITQSDAMVGVQTIQFNIPGSAPYTISISSGLRIREAVIIDATTQPGYSGKPVVRIQPSVPSLSYGIYAEDSTPGFDATLSVTIKGLAIGGFSDGQGILLGNGQNHLIEGNYIGVDVDGVTAKANDVGLYMRASNSIIRGNVISSNENAGIILVNNGSRNSFNNQIVGNYIGVDFSGTLARPNQDGIHIIEGASNNTIGGTTPVERNLISGNTRWGVLVSGSDTFPEWNSTSNSILGNYIGTDASGTLDLGNGSIGVFINNSDNNVIGGSAGTTPGGGCTGACNLISGNNGPGINIVGNAGTSENNLVQGNFIGADVTGTLDLGNAVGIAIDSKNNIVGGTAAQARNLISGNDTGGIHMIGTGSLNNVFLGNFIGTDTTGTAALGNSGPGIYLASGARGHQIGDGTTAGLNRIAFNSGRGIYLDSTTTIQNRISGNAIFSNADLGIDLYPDGVNPNDAGDADSGANGLQNYPVVSAVLTRTETVIDGTLDSTANRDFVVQLFYNAACDSTGYGEGQFFVASLPITTNASGSAAFQTTINPPLPIGASVTAVAIDANSAPGATSTGDTSEFSQCRTALADLAITKGDAPDPVLPGQNLVYTLNVSSPAGASYANNVVVSDPLPEGVTFVSAESTQGTCGFNMGSNTVTCNLGQMTNGASVTVTIDTQVEVGLSTGTLSNSATVTSDTPDPAPANNSVTQTTTIAQADLQVTMTDAPDPAFVDTFLRYTLVVANLGPDTATSVSLADTLPANVTLVAADASQGNCTPGSGSVNCALGTLNNGSSATVMLLVRPTSLAQNTTIVNLASVSALQVDPVGGNNTASASTQVRPSTSGPLLRVFDSSTPTLTWNALSGVAGYHVQVDDSSTFASPDFQDPTLPSSSLSVATTPLADGLWYWRVRAKQANGSWGSWSAPESFVVDAP